jgi:hypothetical protein
VWGSKYLIKLDFACVPAILAPGNLPYLAQHFDCELVIVTQSNLFDEIRSLPSVRAATQYCSLRLVGIDDVLSHQSYYGFTITHALYRGFLDLGDGAKDIWCLFLNADFIIADGSYRTIVKRILAGETCIFAPSYCAIEENTLPTLCHRTAEGSGVLRMSHREMANLILRNLHLTVRAKIINWSMYKIDRVDQFYYLLDNNTLLGRQLPIALVAFRPERIPLEPVTFWDYGVVSEICPSSELCVLGDSDEFLMLELRGRNTMSEQFRLGGMDKLEIARDISIWTTKDQRDCGEYPLVLHCEELPSNYPDGLRVLENYYRGIMQHVTREPRSHLNHYIWTGVVELHKEWMRSQNKRKESKNIKESTLNIDLNNHSQYQRSFCSLLKDFIQALAKALLNRSISDVYRSLFDLMRPIYLFFFGRIPDVGPLHPHWCDLKPLISEITLEAPKKVLAIWSISAAAIAPHMSHWADEVVISNVDDILRDDFFENIQLQGLYDSCFLELSRDEFMKFSLLHDRIRTLIRKGGVIRVFYQTKGCKRLVERDFKLIANGMPKSDIGILQIRGNYFSFLAQQLWERARGQSNSGRTFDLIRFAILALFIAPLSLFANWKSLRTGLSIFTKSCTSLCLIIKII